MATYPIATDIAWRVIDQFIEDWKKSPNHWIREREIQAEIYSRIKRTFQLMNYDNLKANYTKDEDGRPIPEIWSRIELEPPIKYPKDVGGGVCRPDIVIWDNLDNIEKPPDAKNAGGNFPIQLAIEIKTNFEDEGDIPDIEKLKCLLVINKSGEKDIFRTVRYGVWLDFHFEDGTTEMISKPEPSLPIW